MFKMESEEQVNVPLMILKDVAMAGIEYIHIHEAALDT